MSWENFEKFWQELWAYLYKVIYYFYPEMDPDYVAPEEK